jgi:hypothetical protein
VSEIGPHTSECMMSKNPLALLLLLGNRLFTFFLVHILCMYLHGPPEYLANMLPYFLRFVMFSNLSEKTFYAISHLDLLCCVLILNLSVPLIFIDLLLGHQSQ